MRGHAVVGHLTPWVVLGGGLGVPHITSVPPQVARFQSLNNSLSVGNLTTRSVDQPATLLEVGNHGLVEQVLSTLHAQSTR